MSNAAINGVWNEKTTKGSERLVLLILADRANDQLECWPSIKTIADQANLDRRYVIRILNKLEESGIIHRVYRWNEVKNKNDSNLYKLNLVVVYKPLGSGQEATRGSVLEDTRGSGQEATRTHIKNHNNITPKEPITLPKNAKEPEPSLFPLAMALSEVSGLSLEANKARIFREAKLLSKDPNATPERIRADYGAGGLWYSCDWRGQKGQTPTLEQVRSTFGTFKLPKKFKTVGDVIPEQTEEKVRSIAQQLFEFNKAKEAEEARKAWIHDPQLKEGIENCSIMSY